MLFRLFLVLACFVVVALPAHAHSPIPGIEGFYIGLIDPFRALPQLLALGCLGLLITSFDNSQVPWFLGLYLVGTLTGIVLGTGLAHTDTVLLVAALLASLWAAALPGRFAPAAFALVAVGGIYLGSISIPDPGPLQARIVTVSGSFVGLNVGLLYIAGGVLMAKEKLPQARVALGCRIAALVLGCITAFVLLQSFLSPDSSPVV